MRHVTDSALKESLGDLLDLVARGEQVVITRDGRPVARLVREPTDRSSAEARAAVDRIIARSKGVTLGGLKIKDLITEGRR